MVFDPNEYLKEPVQEEKKGFDPNQYLADQADAQKEVDQIALQQEYTPTKSAMLGAAEGASFGLADEGGAALRALYEKTLGEDEGKSWTELYRQYQNEMEKMGEEAQQANPKSYLAGSVVGGIAAPLPGGSLLSAGKGAVQAAKAGKILEGVGKTALEGAKYGGLYGAGTSKAEIIGTPEEELPTNIAELGKDIVTSGATGAVVGGGLKAAGVGIKALKGAQKPAEELSKELSSKAAKTALEVLAPNAAWTKKAFSKGAEIAGENVDANQVNKMGNILLKENILSHKGSFLDMENHVEDLIQLKKADAKNILSGVREKLLKRKAATDKLNLSIQPEIQVSELTDLAQKKLNDRLDGLMLSPAEKAPLMKDAEPLLNLIQGADLSGDVNKLLEAKYRIANEIGVGSKSWLTATPELKNKISYLRDVYRLVNARIDGMASSVDPKAALKLKELNSDLSSLYPLKTLLSEKAILNKEIKPITVGELATGGLASTFGAMGAGPVGAALGPGLLIARRAIEAQTGKTPTQHLGVWQARKLQEQAKQALLPQTPSKLPVIAAKEEVIRREENESKVEPKDMYKFAKSNSSDLDIINQKGRALGPGFEPYARLLDNLKDKDDMSRMAILKTLLEQPGFRKYYRQIQGK